MSSSIVTERAKITDMGSQDPRSGCFVSSCVVISILPKLTENSFLHSEDEADCHLWGWRCSVRSPWILNLDMVGTVVKSTQCPCRGPWLSSQMPRSASQPPVTSAPRILALFWSRRNLYSLVQTHWHSHIHPVKKAGGNRAIYLVSVFRERV